MERRSFIKVAVTTCLAGIAARAIGEAAERSNETEKVSASRLPRTENLASFEAKCFTERLGGLGSPCVLGK